MKNKSNRYSRMVSGARMILFMGLLASQMPAAQGQVNKKSKDPMNRWAVGARLSHLYDIKFTGYDLLNNGFAGEDLQGLNGSKTKFDIGLGLDVTYFWTPLISVDLAYDFGKMTGANQVDYYNSNVNFLQMGVNFDIKTKHRTTPYTWVPYVRASVGRGSFDTERKFIVDDGTFHEESGSVMVTGLGGGVRYHINHNLHLAFQSEFTVAASDAWDGYNYGSGKEHMLKTTLAVRYTFGKNPHEDRGLAWQGGSGGKNYDEVILALQDSLQQERRQVAKANSDIAAINAYLTKDTDKDGLPDIKDHCPDVAANTKNGCPIEVAIAPTQGPSQVNVTPSNPSNTYEPQPKSATQIKRDLRFDMNKIYFGVNSSSLNTESLEILKKAVKVMKDNPEILVSILGYTDYSGSVQANQTLSLKRAQVVYNYLVGAGISKDRLQIVPLGPQPKDGKDYLNRRVEIIIE